MITEQDIQITRRPSELSTFISRAFETISKDKNQAHSTRMLERQYKYLVQEVYPLSVFCKWRFPADDVLVTPCIGNQGYDAEIDYPSTGARIRVEVCWPIDGKQQKQDALELKENGITKFHVGNPDDDFRLVAGRVIKALSKKAQKDYSDSIILTVLDLWPSFFPKDPSHRQLFCDLIKQAGEIKFRAHGVFLMLWPPEWAKQNDVEPIAEIPCGDKKAQAER